MSAVSLEEFANELVQDVLATADAEGSSAHDAFAERVLQDLESTGVLEEHFVAYYRAHGVEISGYGRNEPIDTLDLFVVQFRQFPLMEKAGKSELSVLARRALTYLGKASKGLRSQIDDADDAHDMALAVEQLLPTVSSIRVFVITNDVATVSKFAPSDFEGKPVSIDIWDLKRLHRLATSGVLHEPITVEFPEPLPCLTTPMTEENYSVLLAIIPGETLARVYAEYGARLLELNVRSFLQLKGAVNKGIRETLINRPERFLAYNNGISATGSKVELLRLPEGGFGIHRIRDLQIVNGGQTTASLHHALTKDKLDLSHVQVQMKLTVVQPDLLDVIVPEISKFSNTQNKVTLVDFSSNHAYHVALEQITRTLWAPSVDGSGQETKWFYERARGQYADALSKERTPAAKKKFRGIYPTKQKFTKTDVAKWEMAWHYQKPQVVSRGGEKNFRAFMDEVKNTSPTTDVDFVKRLLAKGILFREADRVVAEQNYGGYKANIVAYTVSKISNATAMRLNLDQIWLRQGISDALAESIAEVSRIAHKVISSPPAGTANVGEWTKKDACWTRILETQWDVPADLEAELLSVSKSRVVKAETVQATMTAEDVANAELVKSISAESWFALSKWAKETGNLVPWQRSLAFSMGRLLGQEREPSPKQSKQGAIILDEALRRGFQP